MSLLGRFRIRHGMEDDAKRCQQITRQPANRAQLPFVMLPALKEAARARTLHVAELDGEVVGFVNFYARRDGQQTVHEIAVDTAAQGLGIGRALLYSVPAPVFLKCKADNPANAFYASAGMAPAGMSTARNGTALNHWRLDILAQLVQGNNARMPEVARRSGMAYGTRHVETPRDWPFAVDIHWRDYDWSDYMGKVSRWRPVQALAPDYEHPSQRKALYSQIRDLKAAGVLRVLVCPKFPGAVAHTPSWCVVAVSIPSSYAGFVPDFAELKRRRVHLLGGSPVQWFGQAGRRRDRADVGYLAALQGAGATVISVDGNAHTKVAASGGFWDGGRWRFGSSNRQRPFDLYELAALSGRNINAQLNEVARYKQLSLFGGTI